MKAISIRAPWWWFILHGGKDIENRDWPTKFRGRVLVHASKWWNAEEVNDDWSSMRAHVADAAVPAGLTLRDLRHAGGAIVGSVEITDCVERSYSPWFFGRYGFVLANPRPLSTPIPFKGALGLFDVPNHFIGEAGHRPDLS